MTTKSNFPSIIVKTQLDLENIAAARIMEILPKAKVVPRPSGFKGIVLVYSNDPVEDSKLIKREILEAERVIPALKTVDADLNKIVNAAKEVAVGRICRDDTFAVRTVRRGTHNFTSIDVNVSVGAIIKKVTNADVNLDLPDKIVAVEIINDKAMISILPGSEEHRKMRPGKKSVLNFLYKISLIQMPYLGPLDANYNMGVRIGRAAQNFEIKEMVIAPIGITSADQVMRFLEGIYDGINTRYKIQKKIYFRPVNKVSIYIGDLYQVVRDRFDEPLIIFEPEGEPLIKVKDEIVKIFNNKSIRRINLLVGARKGIPIGIYRYADLIIDLAPEVTISTDFAASSAIISLVTILQEQNI